MVETGSSFYESTNKPKARDYSVVLIVGFPLVVFVVVCSLSFLFSGMLIMRDIYLVLVERVYPIMVPAFSPWVVTALYYQ